jgi:heterodisulfide reductase subunit C/quinone-modifying oxidoreductase subunit QmoC
VVHILRVSGLEMATHYSYAIHLMISVPMLVIEMPFGKWTHMIYRPLALYFLSLREKTAEYQVASEGVPEYVAS